jgi:hypothetical protein
MINKILILTSLVLFISGCFSESPIEKKTESFVKYNIIKPGNGIYVITKKNVKKEQTKNNFHEVVYYTDEKIAKIERFNKMGEYTDSLAVAAVTVFEYNSEGKTKYIRYYDKEGNRTEDEVFGYWSIEYIYDEQNRVRMEIYRDADTKFLEVPRDNSGNIAKINFLSPVLTYEYIGDNLKIKALDHNFNLLKEVYGDKPCVPFIDCGEED